jgi:hypothetical protein
MQNNIPAHLAAAINNNSGVTSVRQPINKAFLGRNALPTEKERNVVSADFDATNRLQIVFDTGERITTKPVDLSELKQDLTIAPFKFLDYIQFDTSAEVQPINEGLLTWNSEDGTLNLGMGDTIGGSLMIADGSINPLRFLGIATHDIPNGTTGYVTNFGGINDIDTTGTPYGETWAAGDIIFVSSTVPGGLTKVRPIPPNVTIAVGAVARYGSTNGRLMVSPRIVPQVVYGAFYGNSSQPLLAIDTAQAIELTNTVESYGLTKGVSTLTVGTSALYVLDFAVSVVKSNSNNEKIWVWLRKNGVNIPNTSMTFTISGNNSEVIASGNFHVKLLAGEAIELMWAGTSTALSLDAEPATDFAPEAPAIRCALFQIND